MPRRPSCPEILRAVGDELRFRILAELKNGPKRVKQINARLGLPQSLLSHHLGVLKKVGLISSRRDGKGVLYRMAHPARGAGRTVDLGCCVLKFK